MPSFPKKKVCMKLGSVHLTQADSPIDGGYEVLTTVLSLLSDPQALYQASSLRARKVMNKAIFGKLYVQADEQGPYVARDELNEPFETVLYARRESSLAEALEKAEARWSAGSEEPQAPGDLLVAALGSPCSSKNRMVGRTYQHANRDVLVEGDPLPVRLLKPTVRKATR
jgi:hypothetical protein